MYGFAIPTDITSGTDELFNFIYQNGGSATDKEGNIQLATPENIEALEYLKKFNDTDLFLTLLEQQDQIKLQCSKTVI